jgi:hypothetical protein
MEGLPAQQQRCDMLAGQAYEYQVCVFYSAKIHFFNLI